MAPSVSDIRRLLWETPTRRRVTVAIGIALVLAGLYPYVGGAVAARVFASKASERLGLTVRVGEGRAGLRGVQFSEVEIVGPEGRSLVSVAALHVPFSAAWGGGVVRVGRPRIAIDAADEPAVRAARARFGGQGSGGGGSGGGAPRARPRVEITDGSFRLATAGGHSLVAERFGAIVEPGTRVQVALRGVVGALALGRGAGDPSFSFDGLDVDMPLAGLRPAAPPRVRVHGGALRPLPTLALTGIGGEVGPATGAVDSVAVDLHGSYGGARERLWNASGKLQLPRNAHELEGLISLRADRFTLDKISDVLPASILTPENTMVDASLDLRFHEGRVGIAGTFDVSGLSVHHPAVASEPALDLAMSFRIDGELDVARRRLALTLFEARLRDLVGRLQGQVELLPRPHVFADGSSIPVTPRIDLGLRVSKIPCQKALASIPSVVVPHLQGFEMKGGFEADLGLHLHFDDLESLQLTGKIGIDGCTVIKAPDEVVRLGAGESVPQIVEVPTGPAGDPGTTEMLAFVVGPENPSFVPFEEISPHLVNAILTTEDSGFWKHKGFATSEFRTALKRNLERGGFRLGASSITMQMVKNLLLSQEKTLSRKLQELFLVWHLERMLPKERILELYFNAIEYGPRIYGIGPAARHYFGKSAWELTPLEAVFFSSILPSPKRRYVHYCKGSLTPQWDKYLRRILTRMHERGRLNDEEFEAVKNQPFMFDLTARGPSDKECLEWVKRMTQKPVELELPPPEEDLSATPR